MNTSPPPHLSLTLADGIYARTASMHLLRGWMEAQVRFLESQMDPSDTMEDLAMRERQIERLQHDFAAIVRQLASMGDHCMVRATLEVCSP